MLIKWKIIPLICILAIGIVGLVMKNSNDKKTVITDFSSLPKDANNTLVIIQGKYDSKTKILQNSEMTSSLVDNQGNRIILYFYDTKQKFSHGDILEVEGELNTVGDNYWGLIKSITPTREIRIIKE